MKDFELPAKPILSSAFQEKGRTGVVKIEALPIQDGDFIKLVFESVKSPWRQGVWMKTDGHLLMNLERHSGVELWQDSSPKEVPIKCYTKDGFLYLHNIWDSGRLLGVESQSLSSGMVVETITNGRRYHCNDIGFDTMFDKLVFRIEKNVH